MTERYIVLSECSDVDWDALLASSPHYAGTCGACGRPAFVDHTDAPLRWPKSDLECHCPWVDAFRWDVEKKAYVEAQ